MSDREKRKRGSGRNRTRGAGQDSGETRVLECPWCGNAHFIYAGYLAMLHPSEEAGAEGGVSCHPTQVMVCTKCSCCYIWHEGGVRDVTKLVDLRAWADLQKSLHDSADDRRG
jgi:hypothetical protein